MAQQIDEVEFVQESMDAFRQFGAYANYRAIPDVRDGLKPGGRRVLWAMRQNGYVPGKRTVKAMSAVGDILKYHPHGDSGTYDAMVTMAHVPSEGKPVKRYQPLIYGQGGWGDLDHGASAPRYTECRLNEHAMALLGIAEVLSGAAEVDENGVDMVLNYAGDRLEPTVLPALWPAFVVNGVEGIGAGVATNAPSHNMVEVLNLAIRMVDNPNPRWSTIQSILPGPDMPCEADIFDGPEGNNIQTYMEEGYGSFIMRARFTVEEYQISARKKGHEIVVTGLPYRVSPSMVVEGVSNLRDSGDLPQDIEVANYTDIKGIRVVIDLKENDPEDVVQRLLYYGSRSRFQESFSVNSNALVDGQVRTIGTIEALRHWIDHRRVVVRRRSRFRLEKAEVRMEIVLGFLKAIPIANELVDLVRASDNRAHATEQMIQRWAFTENQCQAILDMTIGQITKLGVERYENEKVELQALIDECNDLLSNPDSLDKRLKQEMRAIRDEYATDRRCALRLEEEPWVARPETPAVEIPAIPGYLARTGKNYVRWVSKRSIQRVVGNDHVVEFVRATDVNRLEAVSNLGVHYRTFLGDVPEKMVKADGLFPLDPGETLVLANTSLSAPGEEPDLVMLTKSGLIKRIEFDVFASHREAPKYYPLIPLEEDDEVTHAFFLPQGADIAILTAYGKMLRMENDTILAKGKGARGNPAIRLQSEDDYIVWAGYLTDEDEITYWTSEEKVGWFSAKDVATGNRNTQGQTITQSRNLILGAVRGFGDLLRWFDGTTDEPSEVVLNGQAAGVSLTDRQLKIAAPRIKRANAVWLESTEGEDDD